MSALRHDVAEPDPFCYGDDPCVCEQLALARADVLKKAREAVAASCVPKMHFYDYIATEFVLCEQCGDAIAAIDSATP